MAVRHVQDSIYNIHINNRCLPFRKFSMTEATADEKTRGCCDGKRKIKQLDSLLSGELSRAEDRGFSRALGTCVPALIRCGFCPGRNFNLSLSPSEAIFRSCAPIRMSLAALRVRARILLVQCESLFFFYDLQ